MPHPFGNIALIVLLCLGVTPLYAQPAANPSPIIPDRSFDSVTIGWPRTVWFGKGKITLDSSASATFKEGITSSSNKVKVDGQKLLMMKMPFRVELQDSTLAKFKIEGKKYWTTGTWVEDGGGFITLGELLHVPEILQVESETYIGDPTDLEIREAEISHSQQPDEIWSFYVKRKNTTGAIRRELDAYFSNGSRIITMRGPVQINVAEPSSSGQEFTYYEFIEGGKPVAWASRWNSVVYFPEDTPRFTRSLLLAVVIALSI